MWLWTRRAGLPGRAVWVVSDGQARVAAVVEPADERTAAAADARGGTATSEEPTNTEAHSANEKSENEPGAYSAAARLHRFARRARETRRPAAPIEKFFPPPQGQGFEFKVHHGHFTTIDQSL